MSKANGSPKGKLILVGGNEAKKPEKSREGTNQNIDFSNGVLEEILKESPGENPVIEIIPAASKDQEQIGKVYTSAFAKFKIKPGIMILRNKDDAGSDENLERIERADIVFFTGGDQVKLFDIMHGTRLWKKIQEKYLKDDCILAGTSSGAMVMPKNMIISGDSDESVLKGIIEVKKGLNIIDNVIVDTHFLSRGRVARLAESLLILNDDIGLGICEDTGLVITEGRFLRVIGSGTVVLMEGKNIKSTNYFKIRDKDPVYIENLTMHILANGAGYDLSQRRFVVPDTKKEPRHAVSQ